VAVVTRDEELGRAVFALLGGAAYSLGDSHIWFVIR
jgi:hypothetical protein